MEYFIVALEVIKYLGFLLLLFAYPPYLFSVFYATRNIFEIILAKKRLSVSYEQSQKQRETAKAHNSKSSSGSMYQ